MFEQTPKFLLQYLPLLIFMGIAAGLSIIVALIPYILATKKPNKEKLSQYECGFEPLSSAHKQFNIKFYLVAIIFIIFDLEILFLFPWAITLGSIGLLGFWSMIIFLSILTIGFIYEWRKGALDWE